LQNLLQFKKVGLILVQNCHKWLLYKKMERQPKGKLLNKKKRTLFNVLKNTE